MALPLGAVARSDIFETGCPICLVVLDKVDTANRDGETILIRGRRRVKSRCAAKLAPDISQENRAKKRTAG